MWKDVKGYEGLYLVSDTGEVKGVKRGKLLSQNVDDIGYPYVNLSKNNKGRTVRVHRILAEAFIPNPEGKPQVNHINGVKTDYSLDNLEWVTCSENKRHALATGLAVLPKNDGKHLRKLSDEQAEQLKGEYDRKELSQRALAKKYGVSKSAIQRIVTGVSYRDQ